MIFYINTFNVEFIIKLTDFLINSIIIIIFIDIIFSLYFLIFILNIFIHIVLIVNFKISTEILESNNIKDLKNNTVFQKLRMILFEMNFHNFILKSKIIDEI